MRIVRRMRFRDIDPELRHRPTTTRRADFSAVAALRVVYDASASSLPPALPPIEIGTVPTIQADLQTHQPRIANPAVDPAQDRAV
ncbi:hypothetical protein ASE73_09990 [Sphingomonas sp. Leaf24]|nr:hypothetical protein ASE50_08040 [Sphingomonas sp. Leaf5]KQM87797.1 hypothetical protein ASE73_09990 [Sphingomonas sp. Leaf24]